MVDALIKTKQNTSLPKDGKLYTFENGKMKPDEWICYSN
jgi:hypothetical protein